MSNVSNVSKLSNCNTFRVDTLKLMDGLKRPIGFFWDFFKGWEFIKSRPPKKIKFYIKIFFICRQTCPNFLVKLNKLFNYNISEKNFKIIIVSTLKIKYFNLSSKNLKINSRHVIFSFLEVWQTCGIWNDKRPRLNKKEAIYLASFFITHIIFF